MPIRQFGALTAQEAQTRYSPFFMLNTRDDALNNEYISIVGANFDDAGALRDPSWVAAANEANVEIYIPIGITITSIYAIVLPGPGAAASRTFTVRRSGVDTAATITLSGAGAAVSGSVSLNVNIAALGNLTIGHTLTGVPGAITHLTIIIFWHVT